MCDKSITTIKIAFGGGCHWCTEAVYQSLKGVSKVEQGYVAMTGKKKSFSEAVIVHFDKGVISLNDLVAIHLYTHKSTSDHSMREKYRSAVYIFSDTQLKQVENILLNHQSEFKGKLITKVYRFHAFKPSEAQFMNYYYSNPDKPFCQTHVQPKLELLLSKFSKLVAREKFNSSQPLLMFPFKVGTGYKIERTTKTKSGQSLAKYL